MLHKQKLGPTAKPGREGLCLYAACGERKYLNRDERARALEAAKHLPQEWTLFCLTLAWTGARLSEVLALTAASF